IYLNDKYYSIPQGVYTPRLGYDYAGKELTDFSKYPTIDVSSGSDFMKYRAHLLSTYFGYDAFDDLKLGFKVNYSTIEKTGSFGSSNYWQYQSYDNSTSVWHNIEEREQKYHHFDLSAGALYKLNATMNLGLVAGFIPGKVTQDISKIDTSLFEYGTKSASYWSFSKRFAVTDQSWQNKGNTFYGGAQFKTELKENQHLFFRYNYLNSKQDLTLGSYILDTSFYQYQYKEKDTIRSKSDSYMKLFDDRYGSGTQKNFMHEFQALLLWQIEPSITFNFGVYYSYQKTAINTLEFVKADRVASSIGFSNYSYSSYQSYRYFQAVKEEKNLDWNFEMIKTTFQIPIYLEWKIRPEFTFMIGLNRMFSDTEIEDVTVAYFNYREVTDTAKTTKKTFFGERYTMPKESISDVTTSVFFGMIISPSNTLSLQFLVRPAFSDEKKSSQFWISGLLRL
ncbi:MAG: hypothetical protein N3A61_09955, partial [Ignavibacteria bacterium]|nr:hypothetical protein [Ignavibacteria bacterium]